MARIACLLATVASLAAAGAPASFAAVPRHTHASRPQPRPASVAVVARPMVVYGTTNAARTSRPFPPAGQSRAANPLSYLPPASPDAPRFSFSPQDPPEGWHWQRVSLQQVDAEVRARRAEKRRDERPSAATR